MEAIRNYVEALFAALPQREDVLRVKADMLANLEDKFNALLDEGKNEAEATGLVIASIGSAEELREELGYQPVEQPTVFIARPRPELPILTAKDWRAIGLIYLVWATVLVVVTYIAGELCFYGRFLPYFGWTTAIMLVCIAAGVRFGYTVCLSHHVPIRFYALSAVSALPAALCAYFYLGHYWGLWGAAWTYFPAVGVLLLGAAWLERTKIYGQTAGWLNASNN